MIGDKKKMNLGNNLLENLINWIKVSPGYLVIRGKSTLKTLRERSII